MEETDPIKQFINSTEKLITIDTVQNEVYHMQNIFPILKNAEWNIDHSAFLRIGNMFCI